MTNDETGPLHCEFPRTLSLKNWPFLLMLAFLAGVAAYAGIATGRTTAGLALAGAVLVPAVIVLLIQTFGGFFARRVTAAYENGLVIRRYGRDELIAWKRVGSITLREESIALKGVAMSKQFMIRVEYDGGQVIDVWPLSGAPEAAVFMGERAGVQVQS